MGQDMKDWIQTRADELSLERFGKEFHTLIDAFQAEVWKQAEQDYVDYVAGMADAARDSLKERGMR